MRTPTPSLVWPPLAVGDKPSQKTLRVANKALRSREIARDRARLRGMHCATALTARVVSQGPKDAEVVWSLHAPPDATWPIEAAVHTGAEGRLRLKVTSPTITTPLSGVPEAFLASHYMKVLCPVVGGGLGACEADSS